MNKIRALVIDDEPDARELLLSLLQKYCPAVEVISTAENVEQGLSAIDLYKPQLVFLDISMPDGTGFHLLEKARPVFFDVIFITAHNEYAVQAIRTSALDYLLKPIRIEELQEAVNRHVQKLASLQPGINERVNLFLEMAANSNRSLGKLVVPLRNGYSLVEKEEILYCESFRNYTKIYLKDKEWIMASQTLKEYEYLLNGFHFLRIHKSYLVNLKFVKQYVKGEGGSVILTDGTELEVSRRSKQELLKKFTA